jgi:hypothetical protein
VAITLDERAAVLDEVMVYGTRRRGRSSSGFFERRQRGFGHFITKQEIEQWHPRVLSEVFHHIPGIQVVPTTRGFGHKLSILRAGSSLIASDSCVPAVYLDGMLLRGNKDDDGNIDWFVAPQDVAGIEVYVGPATAPPQFPDRGCGSVVIWTGFHARS